MISITLNFSSIEAARKVLLEIPSSALSGGPAGDNLSTNAAKTDTSEKRVQKSAKTEQVEAPKPVAEPIAPAAPAAPTVSSPASAAVDYPTLQKAVFALAGKSRDSAAAVAASLGVKTFKELDQEKWAEALVAVSGKLAELEAA